MNDFKSELDPAFNVISSNNMCPIDPAEASQCDSCQ